MPVPNSNYPSGQTADDQPLDMTNDPDLAGPMPPVAPGANEPIIAAPVRPAGPAAVFQPEPIVAEPLPDQPVEVNPAPDFSPIAPPAVPPPAVTTGGQPEAPPSPSQIEDPQVAAMGAAEVSPPSGEVAGMHSGGSASSILKKLGLILLVFLLLGAVGFGLFRFVVPKFLGNKSPDSNGPQTKLTYWGLWEPEAVMDQVINEWNQAHPEAAVDYVLQSPQEYRERLQSALARGEGPDIFRFHLTWTPMFEQELEPIPSAVFSAAEFESSFYPVAVEHLRANAGLLGIPLMMDNLALFYNDEIFQMAGKTPPTTWEELRQTALDLTVKDQDGRISVAGVPLGTTSNVDHWSDILGLMMLQNGIDLANPGLCTMQTTGEVCLGADALTFFTLFTQADGVWDETMPNSTLAFATGKAAMYFGPSWRIFEIQQLNPQLKFKVAPVPQLSTSGWISWASFWVEGVAKKSSLKKQAWEFLQFLASQDTMEKLYQSSSQTRLFGEIYSRRQMGPALSQNPLLKPFVDQAAYAQTWYLCSRTFDNGLNDRMIKYFEDAVNAVNRGESAKEALQTTTSGISQLLSQYGLAASAPR